MLFGREAECARLDRLLTDARSGRSDTLVLVGEAGIGKTALCDYARARAEGFRVLSCAGVESESELAFAALGDLVRPVQDRLAAIPKPQAAALAGGLALGPPVAADRYAVCAATLSLLAAVAEEGPVLALVDDAQWIDASSAEALLFACRRLEAEKVAVLFALRPSENDLFERAGLPRLPLGGLDRSAAAELLERVVGRALSPDVVERLWRATAGNPLALVEIPSLLTQAQLDGHEPVDEKMPPAVVSIERAMLHRVRALPEATQEALVIAAASDSPERLFIEHALEVVGLDPRALDPAEAAGFIVITDGRLEFRHPLLRSAIYRSAPSGARREAHAALAQASQAADRRAWHLTAAAGALDAHAAAALEQAALDARARGGLAESASAFERAAQLSPEPRERSRRLRQAADDARLVGRGAKARELLDAALECASTPLDRAQIEELRGWVEMWYGSPALACELLAAEAARVEEIDSALAARLRADAARASFMAGAVSRGVELARSACVAGSGRFEQAALALGLMLTGQARSARSFLTDIEPVLDDVESPERPRQLASLAGHVLLWLEEYERARAVLTRIVDDARAGSALGILPYALSVLSEANFRTGNWASAYADASEGVRIADETRQLATIAFGLVCLARVEAAQGREEECYAHVERALAIAERGIGLVLAYADSVLGLLELGIGRSERAVEHLERLARRLTEHGLREPAVIQSTPDLIEAYIRAGREGDAQGLLDEFERIAADTGRGWALAAAARCRGLLASDDEFEQFFADASRRHADTPTPFERARTELCLGERLRRARRRADARAPLRSAIETFDRLGALPWAERARAELAATGETVGKRRLHPAEQLTPQELQIALTVARGATNKEAGAKLFLSHKTIETHLGHIYRKLNLRSRTELAHLLASETAEAELDAGREAPTLTVSAAPWST